MVDDEGAWSEWFDGLALGLSKTQPLCGQTVLDADTLGPCAMDTPDIPKPLPGDWVDEEDAFMVWRTN